jgi:hypothetical protein
MIMNMKQLLEWELAGETEVLGEYMRQYHYYIESCYKFCKNFFFCKGSDHQNASQATEKHSKPYTRQLHEMEQN